MKQLNIDKIRNFLFDWIGHILLLGNIAGYWLGYETAVIQYQGDKIFIAFLAIALILGYGIGWFFENAQEIFKISIYNEWDAIRTAIGFVGGFVTSFYYRNENLMSWYCWIYLVTAILYIVWCLYIKRKQSKK